MRAAGAVAVRPAAREQLAADAAALQRLRRRRRARSPRRPRGSARAPTPSTRPSCSATQQPPGSVLSRWRMRACWRAARTASCSPSNGRVERPRRRRGRRRPRPRRAWGGCRRRASAQSQRSASQRRVDALPFAVAHGRPQAEAVALAHVQASRPAQDLGADLQRVPDVPQPAPAAPRLPDVRLLRRARGRARARPRSRPRALDHPPHWVACTACPSRSRSTPTAPTSGPPKSPRARRTQPSRGCASCSSGPPSEFGEVAEGIEVVDAPVSIAKAPDPVRASRATPDASIVLAARAVAAGDADAFVSGGSTGPALAAGAVQHQARHGHPPPGARDPGPGPRAPGHDRRRRRQRRGARRAPRPVRLHGRRAGPGRARHRAPARRRCSRSARRRARARRSSSRRTPPCATAWPRATPSTSSATSRATRSPAGKADVVVTDGFTGNVALKLMEGVSEEMLRQIRDVADARRGAPRPAACCCARRCSSSAR